MIRKVAYLIVYLIFLTVSCKNTDNVIYSVKLKKSKLDTCFNGGFVSFVNFSKNDTIITIHKILLRGIYGFFEATTYNGHSYIKQNIPIFLIQKGEMNQIYFDSSLDGNWENATPYYLDGTSNIKIILRKNKKEEGGILYINPITSAFQAYADEKLNRKTIGIVMKSYLMEGELSVNNHSYSFVLPSLFSKKRDKNDGFIVFIDTSDIRKRTPLSDNLNYHINDTIYLENYLFRLKAIDTLHQFVKFEKISSLKRKEGIKVLSYLPEFSEKDLSNKKIVVGGIKNKYTILDFWGTWCLPCRELSTSLVELNNKYADKVEIISIAADYSKEDVRNYCKIKGFNWSTVYQDFATGWIMRKLKVESYPTFFLLDKSGKIIFRGYGKTGFKQLSFIISSIS